MIFGNTTSDVRLFNLYSAEIHVGQGNAATVGAGTNNIIANPNFSKNVGYDTTTLVDDYGKVWTINQSGTGNVARITTPKYLSVNNVGGAAYGNMGNIASSLANSSLQIIIKMTLDNWYPADDQTIACHGYVKDDGARPLRNGFHPNSNKQLMCDLLNDKDTVFTENDTTAGKQLKEFCYQHLIIKALKGKLVIPLLMSSIGTKVILN